MSDSIDWRIIDRHLAGSSSPADDDAVRRWLARDPRHATLLEGLRTAAQPDDLPAGGRADIDVAWQQVARRIDEGEPVRPLVLRQPRLERTTVRRGGWWRASASGAALVAAGLLAIVWRSDPVSDLRVASPAMREVASPPGQQTRVTLQDGTRVVLNAGSRLRYAADLGGATRDVHLEGEGYFEVVHDASHPFRVHARGGVAEDLGTRFVVRAYPEVQQLTVAVTEGRVALRRDSAGANSAVLSPGQVGRLAPDGAITVAQDADVERWMSWTRGALLLDGLSLADAAAEIGRRFDVEIVVTSPALAQRRVSARFRDEPLPAVLDAVTLALGARWTRDGRTIVLARAE